MENPKHDQSVTISFYVNGELVVVHNPKLHLSLADYLRDHLSLKGLQLPCKQGGCGACTVILSTPSSSSSSFPRIRNFVQKFDPDNFGSSRPINSCLRPLILMDGLSVTTVEGLGSEKTGLSPLQEALVRHHGTQCGFCSPGFVMSMSGLLMSSPNPTQQEVEDQLDGNLCRCTGYRPILDAFQTFSCKVDHHDGCKIACQIPSRDIEDIGYTPSIVRGPIIKSSKQGITWQRVHSLLELFSVIETNGRTEKIRLVVGNTSTGVYPTKDYDFVIDISRVPELLKSQVCDDGVTIGGALPITDFMNLIWENKDLSSTYPPIFKHLKRVATPQIRNVGSVAGNLMMAHDHADFISDISTILMAANARLYIASGNSLQLIDLITLDQFFQVPKQIMVILEVRLPAFGPHVSFFTYKVALRNVNAHALVNAAFKFEIDEATATFVNTPLIVYGGLKSYSQKAPRTGEFLKGKCFKQPQVFDAALQLLQEELTLDLSFGRNEYRSFLVASFFYKAILSVWPKEDIPLRLMGARTEYVRPISSGTVNYSEGDPSEYPVSLPYPKMSAVSQVTGDAEYLNDLEAGNELYAAFVLSTVASAKLKSIDEKKALAKRGVVAFISADTIGAEGYCNIVSEYEVLFASDEVQYCGQALGLIVAKSQDIASEAAKLVEVTYEDIKTPILTIEDAIQADSFFEDRGIDFESGSVCEAFSNSNIIIAEGEVSIGHQYHFHLETQRAFCIPSENGCMKVYSSTQNPAQVQRCVGVALNRQQHKITVEVKRVGGAYGSKLNRSSFVAMACAIAADKVRRPVKLVLDMSTNMQLVGARSPYYCQYKIGALSNGCVTAIEMIIINNQGAHFDFEYPDLTNLVMFIDNAYNIPNWKLEGKIAKTNLPACTYMRGPVFVEATFLLETAIEHVSTLLGLHPEVVREVNMYSDGDYTLASQHLISCNARSIFKSLQASSDYEKRLEKIEDFNLNNQWLKRGLSMVPVKFPAQWEGFQVLCLVNIHTDGSISIYHSGCEIGQGLDVKVAQVAAMTLGLVAGSGINIDSIYVHTTTSIVANNGAESGGSVTSELCGKAVKAACMEIVERLKTLSKVLTVSDEKPDWQELISSALDAGIDLQARGRVYPDSGPNGPFQYLSFGAGLTEVEVDLLTGETRILRADLLLDCGKSLNPAVDIGQIQGAYVQGLGYHLCEEYNYDTATGKLLSDGTWTYKPPTTKDIPIIFNASLVPNSTNEEGFLRSKFSGEPPYGMSCSVVFALKRAIASARKEQGISEWCQLNSPATVEKIVVATGLPYSMLDFNEISGCKLSKAQV